MITASERQVAAVGGFVLFAVAKLIGIRVTEWRRPADADYGSATSLHKVGGAVDFGQETEKWKVEVMKFFCAGRAEDGFHTSGTGPHYHFTAGGRTVVYGAAIIWVIVVPALKGVLS